MQETVSLVLVLEDKGEQSPIYYASQVLKSIELDYLPLKKLAFVVLMSATKLRPYLMSHIIKVRLNYPLRKVLHRPKLPGELSTWVMMLSTYDIKCVPRNVMKAQALAEFIAEMTLPLETSKPAVEE